ncbi:hypothetical protein GGS20DRAFT_568350 [Poronia punctata]|nr:hypothetical protein GGS20DRAFT_568350 [Poronia punctata]
MASLACSASLGVGVFVLGFSSWGDDSSYLLVKGTWYSIGYLLGTSGFSDSKETSQLVPVDANYLPSLVCTLSTCTAHNKLNMGSMGGCSMGWLGESFPLQ